jgi:hypothetical protein
VPNVLRLRGVNSFFSDVGRVVPDSFEVAGDKGKIEIAPEVTRVFWHTPH